MNNILKPLRLDPNNTSLVVVDVQGTLANMVMNPGKLFETVKLLINGARLFEMEVIWTEHVPHKIGGTHDSIASMLDQKDLYEKNVFSCCGTTEFTDRLKKNCDTVLLCGIESHICVYQTARDLLEKGFNVELITDGISSRSELDTETALKRLNDMGAGLMTAEMALYDLQYIADGDRFRELIKLVKKRDQALKIS